MLSNTWIPPGKNCGMCGENSCLDFISTVKNNQKKHSDCPFYNTRSSKTDADLAEAIYSGSDILGHSYDFVLTPFQGEISARKIVLPFRPDLVEKMDIKKDDIVIGRPMGAGCPIPHTLRVIEADYITGLLYTWVVGPKFSRDKEAKDVSAYHMIGFEGIASQILQEPVIGSRATFLPGFCMMNLNHTGIVNMSLQKKQGLHVRIEDVRILAGPNRKDCKN